MTRPGEPTTAELQRRLDLMAASGIKTGPMLDRAVADGHMPARTGAQLTGVYS